MNQFEIFSYMKEITKELPLEIPPQSFTDMGAQIVSYIEDESITVEIPLLEKYNNPAGMVLGGYLPTFFDLAFGPLSFLISKKSTTSLDLNTTFIRPLYSRDNAVIIKAKVISKTKSYLVFEGKAYNAKNKLVATSTSRMHIFS